MSLAVRISSALILGMLLQACDDTTAGTPHRLHGVWSSVDDFSELPPTTSEEWQRTLDGKDPSYFQILFLRDGTMVVGGLLMGHEDASECRWEVIDESPSQVRLRTTEANGTVAEMVFHVEGPDMIWTGADPPSELCVRLHRAPDIGPFPWLSKYKDRL